MARRDTGPELALRRELHRRGLRYYVHRRPLPTLRREADIIFPRAKVAVFVDGCFWHGCVAHGRRQHRTNGWYWPEKIARNVERDRDTDQRLERLGWVALRVWEHEPVTDAADRVQQAALHHRHRHMSDSSLGRDGGVGDDHGLAEVCSAAKKLSAGPASMIGR